MMLGDSSDGEQSSSPHNTATDDSSDDSSCDESPPRTAAPPSGRTGAESLLRTAPGGGTGASVWHWGTYGTVVRKVDGGAEILWEGGDESTLDAAAYAAALKSYARSTRARDKTSDAERSSFASSCSDNANRPLQLHDKLFL